MPVRYLLTEEDVIAGNDMWRRHQLNIWPLVAVSSFSWLLISAYFARTLTGLALAGASLGILAFLIAVSALTLWHGRKQSRGKAAASFRSATDRGREITVTWDGDGITFRQHKASRKQPWREISRWAESDNTFVLLGTGGMFNPIPKKAFSADELQEMRTHLTRAGARKAKLFFY